jgi:acyl-CoA thioesterase
MASLQEIQNEYPTQLLPCRDDRPADKHLNAANVCQGGALFTLDDVSVAGVSNASGQVCLGINARINYVHSARPGDHLTAEARLLSDGKIPLFSVSIRNDEGILIAYMTSEGYKKRDILPFEGLM